MQTSAQFVTNLKEIRRMKGIVLSIALIMTAWVQFGHTEPQTRQLPPPGLPTPVADMADPVTNIKTRLIEAATRGETAEVGQLLEEGADVNTMNPSGFTLLLLTGLEGHVDTMRLLAEAGDYRFILLYELT